MATSASGEQNTSGFLLGFGHPLLDITAVVEKEFLLKYNLNEDDVILGSEAHTGLVDDLVSKYEVKFTAGGATQNSIRVAQWVLGKDDKCTTFIGCIGRDLFANMMRDAIRKEGIRDHYIDIADKSSGKCVVLITSDGLNRSLVSFPGAARSCTMENTPWHVVQDARIIYTSAFTITTGFDIVMRMANLCQQDQKLFCLNLAARYIAEKQIDKVRQLLPLVDILFGNENEVMALAHMMDWTGELEEVMKQLIEFSDASGTRDHCLVITRGKEPILVWCTGFSGALSFPVPEISRDEVVDTNCAGDAFVGGFLGYLTKHMLTESGSNSDETGQLSRIFRNLSLLERCVREGIFCSRQIIRTSGCNLDALWLAKSPMTADNHTS